MTAPVLTGTVTQNDHETGAFAWYDVWSGVRGVLLLASVGAPPLVALVVVGPEEAVITGLIALAVAFAIGKVVQWTVWAAKVRRADRVVLARTSRSSHTGRAIEHEEKISA